MMLVIGRGVGQGRRAALMTAVGGTVLAGTVQLPLLALGVASLVQASPMAFALLHWAGAAYLVWLGAKLLLRSGRRMATANVTPVSDWTAMREGMINNLSNPKSIVFTWLSFRTAWACASLSVATGSLRAPVARASDRERDQKTGDHVVGGDGRDCFHSLAGSAEAVRPQRDRLRVPLEQP